MFNTEQHQVLQQIRNASSRAATLLAHALEQPHTGSWVALPLEDAVQVRESLEQATQQHPILCDAVTPVDEALADKAWNTLEYSTATIVVGQGHARAHRGRAFSAKNQLSGLVRRIDSILATATN